MHLPTKQSFMDALKNYTVPLVAAVYVLGFAAKLHEYIDKIGWRLTSVAFVLTAGAWVAYVWSSTELTVIEPRTQRKRFGVRPRWLAILLLLATAVPVWFAIQPTEPFRIPSLGVKISNPTAAPVIISEFGEFYLTAVSSPATDTQVAAGRIRLTNVANPKAASLSVAPGAEIPLLATVVNPLRFKKLLEAGELSMRLVIYQTDGKLLTKSGVPFEANELESSYVTLNAK